MSLFKKVKTLNNITMEYLKQKTDKKIRYPYLYPLIGADIIRSVKGEKIRPEEYLALEYFELDKERRKKIISRIERDQMVERFNRREDIEKLENKKQFLRNFKPYLRRDFLILDDASFEDFQNFYKEHKAFVAKDSDSGQGKDVVFIEEISDLEKAYKELKASSFDLIEEIAETHKELKKINPVGLPSMRLMTFIDKEGKVNIIASSIVFSIKNPVVNTAAGGFKAIVDTESGRIVTDAIGKENQIIKTHPVSKIDIKGFTIPRWDELKAMMIQAAKVVESVRYVGWDVSVSERGPLIIEANANRPGINSMQKLGFHRADEKYADFDIIRKEMK